MTSLFIGCAKDNDTPEPEPVAYSSYVSHELAVSYTSTSIKSLFEAMQAIYPDVSTLTDMVQYNVDVYIVTYKTVFLGEEVEVSGLVCVPNSEGVFPIVSFQNGTNTSYAQAPTKNISDPIFKYLQSTAATGYIILMPDYLGFGVSEDITHPYLHKESTVLSVENLIVAVGEMIDGDMMKADWDNDLYLMGYSQGGWATLSTHKDINEKTDLTYSVTASACGAGPYDLTVVQNFMFEDITYPQPVYMAYTGVSYHELGLITNPLSDYFNEPYATELPEYFNGQFTNGEINDKLNDTVAVLVTESFLTGINTNSIYKDFRDALNSNSVYGWNSTEPIKLYHGTADDNVPITTSEQVYQEFITAGASNNVSYIPLPGLNHGTGAIPMILDALLWFTEIENKSAEIVMAE